MCIRSRALLAAWPGLAWDRVRVRVRGRVRVRVRVRARARVRVRVRVRFRVRFRAHVDGEEGVGRVDGGGELDGAAAVGAVDDGDDPREHALALVEARALAVGHCGRVGGGHGDGDVHVAQLHLG